MPATIKTEKSMTMPQIQSKARGLGLKPSKMRKAELIHAIQLSEGNNPCFGRSSGCCPYTDCCFMNDCLKINL